MIGENDNAYIDKMRGERIKECMKERNIKNIDLAKALNYTTQHISYVINGKRKLTKEMAISIADYMNRVCESTIRCVKIPYCSLSEEEREDYADGCTHAPNDMISIPFDMDYSIDYRYLLYEIDTKTTWESFETPNNKNTDYLFQECMKSLLRKHGYDLNIKMHFSLFRPKYNPESIFHKTVQEIISDESCQNELIRVKDGKTLKLSPDELLQLFKDFTKLIISITEREFEKIEWKESLEALQVTQNSKNIEL